MHCVWRGMQNQNITTYRMEIRGQTLASTGMRGSFTPPPPQACLGLRRRMSKYHNSMRYSCQPRGDFGSSRGAGGGACRRARCSRRHSGRCWPTNSRAWNTPAATGGNGARVMAKGGTARPRARATTGMTLSALRTVHPPVAGVLPECSPPIFCQPYIPAHSSLPTAPSGPYPFSRAGGSCQILRSGMAEPTPPPPPAGSSVAVTNNSRLLMNFNNSGHAIPSGKTRAEGEMHRTVSPVVLLWKVAAPAHQAKGRTGHERPAAKRGDD